jgi:cystathionine beta-lyase
LRYTLDEAAFEAAIQANTRLFILCNPHNPVGRAFTRHELTRMAEISLRHDLVICSDEIHCDLLLDGTQHIPLASLDAEIGQHCITLLAPSKTYNLPGLGCSMAIIQNPDLRKRFQKAAAGIVPHVNLLGYVAAIAAYAECEDWLDALRLYLTANRDFAVDFLRTHLPNIPTTIPEATYLLWLDCREAGIEGKPQTFFLEQAKVALNDGAWFGQEGEGFVRLNFGCTRATLTQGLEQLRNALAGNQ